MYDVTKITYTPGDILIFAVDMDCYDVEECQHVYDAIQKQAPDVKVVFIPDDMVEEIIHVQKNSPLYYDLATTTIGGFPNTIPQPYLTNCSDSTSATLQIKDGEVSTW